MRTKTRLFVLLALAIAAVSMAASTARQTDVQALASLADVPAMPINPQRSLPCDAMIGDYINWAKQPGHMVDSQGVGLAVKTRDPNARHEHKFGEWMYARLDVRGNTLHGYYQQYFSDRMDGRQPFDKDADDWLEVTMSPGDGITIKLLSWGGGVTKLTNVYCSSDGFMVARLPGQWEHALMFVLVKTYE